MHALEGASAPVRGVYLLLRLREGPACDQQGGWVGLGGSRRRAGGWVGPAKDPPT
jgi:hypothetical protein